MRGILTITALVLCLAACVSCKSAQQAPRYSSGRGNYEGRQQPPQGQSDEFDAGAWVGGMVNRMGDAAARGLEANIERATGPQDNGYYREYPGYGKPGTEQTPGYYSGAGNQNHYEQYGQDQYGNTQYDSGYAEQTYPSYESEYTEQGYQAYESQYPPSENYPQQSSSYSDSGQWYPENSQDSYTYYPEASDSSASSGASKGSGWAPAAGTASPRQSGTLIYKDKGLGTPGTAWIDKQKRQDAAGRTVQSTAPLPVTSPMVILPGTHVGVVNSATSSDKAIQGSWSGSIKYEQGTDRPGNNLRSGIPLDTANPRLCYEMCDKDPKCMSFTFVQPGVQGPQARCWLKSDVPKAVQNEYCISGVHKRGVMKDFKLPKPFPK